MKTQKKAINKALSNTKLLESESLPDLLEFENEENEMVGYENEMQHLLDGPDNEVQKLISNSPKAKKKKK